MDAQFASWFDGGRGAGAGAGPDGSVASSSAPPPPAGIEPSIDLTDTHTCRTCGHECLDLAEYATHMKTHLYPTLRGILNQTI